MQSKITLLIQTIKEFSKRKKILLLAGSLFVLFLLVFIPLFVLSLTQKTKLNNQQFAKAEYVPDQIIIKYADNVSPNQVFTEKLQNLGVISQEKLFKTNSPALNNFYVLKLNKGSNVLKIKEVIGSFKEIKSADPNFILKAQDIPNDPYFSQMWDLQKIDMPDAWNIGKGSTSIKVGVVDTGIDGSHPELSGKVVAFANCTTDTCQETTAFDDVGHGTHVSGTIGAATNNSVGISGINWEVSFVGAKVLDATGHGDDGTIAPGIAYAADQGVKVINMSLGGSGYCSSVEQSAIDYAVNKGVTVVVAAGNNSQDASGFAPANCNNVLAVGATGVNDQRSYYSNYGSTVALSAPGGDAPGGSSSCTIPHCIYSTWPNDGYQAEEGTSMAAPHVAGVAALLLSVNPGLSVDQVKSCLINNADSISTDLPIGPRLNAFKTLNACSGLAPITGEPTPTANPNVPTSTPTTPPATDLPYLGGKTYIDSNGNNNLDPGETILPGVQITLTQGSYLVTANSDSAGHFYFSKIKNGDYTYVAKLNNIQVSGNVIGISSNLRYDTFNIPFPPSTVVPTATPIPGSVQPTATPTPVSSLQPTDTPIPTVYQTADCKFDISTCKQGAGAIQQCTLRCTPQ